MYLIFIVSLVLKFISRHKGDNRSVDFCLIIVIFPHEANCRAICISRLFKVAKPTFLSCYHGFSGIVQLLV